MNKKLISALFVGALLLGSTSALTSCKDYDDDIDNLQTQIDKAALASDVDALKTSLTSAITTAQSTATTAQTAADAAKTTASTAQTTADAAKTAADNAKTAADNAATAAAAAQTTADAAKTAAANAQTSGDAAQATANEAVAAAAAAQAAAETAQTAAETAQAAADKGLEEIATTQAELAESNEHIANLEKSLADLTSLEATLQGTVVSNTKAIAALQEKYDSLKTEIMNLIGDMITNVSLVASFTGSDPDNAISVHTTKNINILNTTEKANVFGKGLTGELTFTKDKLVTFADGILIRVSPSNADLTKDAVIRLIRSNGNTDINNMITVDGTPTRYDGDIVLTRSTDNTGLWIVKFKLTDNYKASDFKTLTCAQEPTSTTNADGKYYGFGLQINNTAETKTRYVPSEFDIAMRQTALTNQAALDFSVDGNDVDASLNINGHSYTGLKNRFTACEDGTSTTSVDEQIWKSSTPAVAAILQKDDAANYNVNQKYPDVNATAVTTADNRQNGYFTPATVNKAITIKINNASVKAFYVTLDKAYALESSPSEINAWTAYSIDNLNVVQAGSKGTITINSTAANGDKIGFRVYAVNYDGTLIDPDGRAFYVTVGAQAKTDAVSGTITVGKLSNDASVIIPLNTTFASSTTMSGIVMSSKNAKYGVDGSTTTDQASPAFTYTLWKDAKAETSATNWKDAKYIKVTIPAANLANYIDGETYKASISILNSDDIVLNYIDLSITKALPTGYPNTFSWKEGQLVDGVWTSYLQPSGSSWAYYDVNGSSAEVTDGVQSMTNVCNGLDDAAYEFVFKDAQYKKAHDDDSEGTKDYSVTSPYNLTIYKDFINNEAHSTTIYYNYGKIKTYQKADGTWVYGTEDCKVPCQTISTKFACELGTTIQTYAWAQKKTANGTTPETYTYTDMNVVTYGQTSYIEAQYLKGSNAYDNTTFGKTFDQLYTFYNYKPLSATLTSVGSGQEDYFTVSFEEAVTSSPAQASDHAARFIFTPKSGTTPFTTTTVASKLNLKLTDKFGHNNPYSLDVTVKK